MTERQSTVTCPICGYRERDAMPPDACRFFHDCKGCDAVLRPNVGDCCPKKMLIGEASVLDHGRRMDGKRIVPDGLPPSQFSIACSNADARTTPASR